MKTTKKVLKWIKTNKTSIAAILFGILAYLNVEHIVNTPQTVLITVILGALGFAAAKDSNSHSTPEQVEAASETDTVVYPKMSESDRLGLNTAIMGTGYICAQIDSVNFPAGYYEINESLTWDYLGTRPPHR